VLTDTDPGDDCADDGAASCGNNGLCDGAGQCANYAVGTVCANAVCGTKTHYTSSLCEGPGQCVQGTYTYCGKFGCDADSGCKSFCDAENECQEGFCQAGDCF
jgi:hypothetical protein